MSSCNSQANYRKRKNRLAVVSSSKILAIVLRALMICCVSPQKRRFPMTVSTIPSFFTCSREIFFMWALVPLGPTLSQGPRDYTRAYVHVPRSCQQFFYVLRVKGYDGPISPSVTNRSPGRQGIVQENLYSSRT